MSDDIAKALGIEQEMIDDMTKDFPDINPIDLPDRAENTEKCDVVQNTQDDYINNRENTYVLLQNAQASLSAAMKMASNSPHPRSFEVIAQLLKVTNELNNDLLNNSKTIKEIQNGNGQTAETINNVQNNYSLTGTEILDMIENAKSSNIE